MYVQNAQIADLQIYMGTHACIKCVDTRDIDIILLDGVCVSEPNMPGTLEHIHIHT